MCQGRGLHANPFQIFGDDTSPILCSVRAGQLPRRLQREIRRCYFSYPYFQQKLNSDRKRNYCALTESLLDSVHSGFVHISHLITRCYHRLGSSRWLHCGFRWSWLGSGLLRDERRGCFRTCWIIVRTLCFGLKSRGETSQEVKLFSMVSKYHTRNFDDVGNSSYLFVHIMWRKGLKAVPYFVLQSILLSP